MSCRLAVLPEALDALLLALPAVAALAADEPLAVLVEPGLGGVAGLVPGVDETIPWRGPLQEMVERLRRTGGDEAVLLGGGWRAAWLLRRAGIARRWGHGGFPESLLLSPAVRRAPRTIRRQRHASEDFNELLAALAVEPPGRGSPILELPEELSAAGRERLERAHLRLGEGPLLGLVPGGWLDPRRQPGRAGHWPWQRFGELARALRRRRPALQAVVVTTQNELWPAVRIHEETGRLHPVIGPDLDLPGLAAVFSSLDLVVAADSDLLHLAAAAGTLTLALFGPTEPARRAPRGPGHRALRAPGNDLRKLPVEEVVEAVLVSSSFRRPERSEGSGRG